MIEKYIKDNKLKIAVKPNSPKTKITGYDKEAVKVNIKAPPEKGKANKEVIKLFTKLLKKKIMIVSGKASKQKVLKIQ